MRLGASWSTFAIGHAKSLRLLAVGLALVGYGLCAMLLIEHGTVLHGGGGGADTYAYWSAGANLIAGRPIYGNGIGGYAAFLYPPPLAQLFAPLSLLPLPTVVWMWRAVLLVCLRLAAGSWVRAGIALLVFPPNIAEMDVGNVHLIIAAGVAMTIRGRAEGLVPTALTKFASLAALPLAVVRSPRTLLVGVAIGAAIVLASFLMSPQLWIDYLGFLRSMPPSETGWYDLGRGVPLALRLAAAAVVAILAVRWPRLAAVAATLALPVLWFSGLSVLTALLASPDRRSGMAVAPAADAPAS